MSEPTITCKVIDKTGTRDYTFKTGVIKIGRLSSSTLYVHDAARMHAVIESQDDGVYIVDLGSINGTYVNNAPVTKAQLHDGDAIQIGETRIVIGIKHAEAAAPEPGWKAHVRLNGNTNVLWFTATHRAELRALAKRLDGDAGIAIGALVTAYETVLSEFERMSDARRFAAAAEVLPALIAKSSYDPKDADAMRPLIVVANELADALVKDESR